MANLSNITIKIILVILKIGHKKRMQRIGCSIQKNTGKYLSLDETSLSNGELYTILTNKNAHGKKGSIIAIVKGTKAMDVINRC